MTFGPKEGDMYVRNSMLTCKWYNLAAILNFLAVGNVFIDKLFYFVKNNTEKKQPDYFSWKFLITSIDIQSFTFGACQLESLITFYQFPVKQSSTERLETMLS